MTIVELGKKPDRSEPSPTPSPSTPSSGSAGADVVEVVGFEGRARAVDEALDAVRELDEQGASAAMALKDAVEAFHRDPLVHIVTTLKADPAGKALLFELVDDPGVRAVLGLHGIIRPDPITRGRAALESVRPYLQSHGGDVELVRIEAGAAYVRLQGSCNGCSMSAVTLREGVEEALVSGVDEVDRIEVLDDEPTAAFIPLGSVGRKSNDAGWVPGPAASEVPAGQMVRFDVNTGAREPESFVVTNLDQRFAVFRNECVHQGLTLDGGMMSDGVITCPWHGFTFDGSSGECISAPGAQLKQVPTRVDDGVIWVRVGE